MSGAIHARERCKNFYYLGRPPEPCSKHRSVPIRVANIIEEGKLAGPQVRMVRVAAAIEGVDTILIMPRDNSTEFQQLCDLFGVPYIIVPLTRITKEWRVGLSYCLFSPFEVLSLARLLKRERIDLIHA